jgi:nitric oxide dioxygenase
MHPYHKPKGSPVNPSQIDLVQISFEKIRAQSEKTTELFYQRLFELDPTIKLLFHGDIKIQGQKLTQSFAQIVEGLKQPETIFVTVIELAKRHGAYGVKSEHYRTFGEAFLWTLEKTLGPDYTPEVKTAWTDAYALLSSFMIEAGKEI